ncbi:2-succinyl-5-enolpyruvyl-6-hydroxy-3-cyclohexene-1-carboxylic-acid synthase [Lentimicrobium saccharophilum]|uniref:2-succinyl-5-enolpyruvyl-6-hydroxy-3-cyclohexene-1-carboxylate synthase n=1 Tax=Lentimicrobium saccharophilum TaxID=1678841 RepID=A0A0S7C3Q6_9BACT|nr:2-succinyl-5-enolpyruvyl-6-hydroxy-3-cyclohexene-1-carboxylic-acid synthase [Lentimicrobium saccharophilum]GAP43721.1 2-succinyl-5-enolpyruvyl-6-hydroxy-3-cyclohexene-1-carboxylic-acid synthase [Lentimicrobium saccharophilum]
MSQEHLSLLAAIIAEKGITHAVVSPGSRNAPAIIAFSRSGRLKLTSIPDERSAGFYALGMAQQLGRAVALLCTSGSAALNYAPAVAEAYYQKVPLLVITADRPAEWIDQGDGQTIRQQEVYSNFIRKSFHLPVNNSTPANHWHFSRMVNEAVDRTLFPARGPVHLNLPLAEPLYDLQLNPEPGDIRINKLIEVEHRIPESALQELVAQWNKAGSKLILAGQLPPGHDLKHWLCQLADDPSVAVFTETTSNLHVPGSIRCIDRTIEGITDEQLPGYTPDILLTFGAAVVSKKVKALLRKMKPAQHWHINPDPDDFHLDTYQSLTLTIPSEAAVFIRQLAAVVTPAQSDYRACWQLLSERHLIKHGDYLANAFFSDLTVFETLFRQIPDDTHLHLGNSTPIRYAQLFDEASRYATWSNRGTSGIDGCVSTAAGAAAIGKHPVTVITGDIGFFYDSNALWNNHLPSSLRIILINNGGGNIFRVIPGPDRYEELEPYIETSHRFNAEGIAKNFGVNYYSAGDQPTLLKVLPGFYGKQNNNQPALLEIFTPAVSSAEALKNYFKFIVS